MFSLFNSFSSFIFQWVIICKWFVQNTQVLATLFRLWNWRYNWTEFLEIDDIFIALDFLCKLYIKTLTGSDFSVNSPPHHLERHCFISIPYFGPAVQAEKYAMLSSIMTECINVTHTNIHFYYVHISIRNG